MLARARDDTGATGLHYAAFQGDREIGELLLAAGSDINALDDRYGATPTGWAAESWRERGGLLAVEIDDVLFAIQRGDSEWVERLVTRHPALRVAVDREGTPLARHAAASADLRIRKAFDPGTARAGGAGT
jgi:hypothetical protein